jgi:hypothetical protein
MVETRYDMSRRHLAVFLLIREDGCALNVIEDRESVGEGTNVGRSTKCKLSIHRFMCVCV